MPCALCLIPCTLFLVPSLGYLCGMEKFLQELFRNQSYDQSNFFLLAGPCVVESEELIMQVAEKVSGICKNLGIPYVFKSSYRKANRTSAGSFTGLGDDTAMKMLQKTGKRFNLPIVTDIHSPEEAAKAAEYVDILQIPAFLCRQTDLLVAAAKTGKIINVKKGQFVSGEAMKFAVDKIKKAGNDKVMLNERGTTFGYQDLGVDYRNIPAMQPPRVPVGMEVTHAYNNPIQTSGVTGGKSPTESDHWKGCNPLPAPMVYSLKPIPNPAQGLKRTDPNCCTWDLWEKCLGSRV